MPEAAKAETKAGAMAFVRHYVELVNHAQATGDIDELQSAEQAGCRSCRAAREGVRKHYQSGGSINGGDWHIDSASAIRNAAIAGWVVDLNVTFGRQTISFGSSQPDKVNEPGRMILSIQVHRSDDAWKVLEWTRGS